MGKGPRQGGRERRTGGEVARGGRWPEGRSQLPVGGRVAAFIINSPLSRPAPPLLCPKQPLLLKEVIQFYLCQGAVMRFQ